MAPPPDAPGSDPSPIAAARAAVDALRCPGAAIAVGLSGQAVSVKRLSLPLMTSRELAAAVPWEAEQHLPFHVEDVRLGHQVVRTTARTMDVLVVAAKRDRVEALAALVRRIGRRPAVIDVEAFALANAYELSYPDRRDETTVLVHVGARAAVVSVIEQGQLALTRDLALPGEPGDRTAVLAAELRKTVDFHHLDRLDGVMVSGGACLAAGLAPGVESVLGARVDVFDAFRSLDRGPTTPVADHERPAYAVAVGLAVHRGAHR